MKSPFLKNNKQKRALEELLEKGCIPVKNIGIITGAGNGRQDVMELRNQGFRKIIITRWHNSINQFGERTRPGEYFLAPGSQKIVEEALKNYSAKVAVTAEAKSSTLKLNNRVGG